jgi:cyclophilin family peptidyl-prolyl cis-trans isomerase
MEGQVPSEKKTDPRWFILGGFALIALIVVAAIVIPRSGGDSDDSGGSVAAGCKEGETGGANSLPCPDQVLEEGEKATAVVETSLGAFEIDLDTEQAPLTANSFAYLAEEGFYDGLVFHRIVPGFVIQGGDPEGTGSGGPGYSVEEKPPADATYTKGVVAMAKTSTEPPGTSGSQFYVVTGADAGLPPEYAIVGKVGEGLDVVEKIGNVPVEGEAPKTPVTIETVTIEEG